MTAHLKLVVGLGLCGAVTTQFVASRFLPLSEVLRWDNWNNLSIAGSVAGVLVGHLVWVTAKPSQRVSRATVMCVAANLVAWILFLAFASPVTNSEFER